MPPNSIPHWRTTVTVRLQRQVEKKVTIFTNPCLTSKWEASDGYIFLVFSSPSSLLSFTFANISVPVVHYLCQLQSPLRNPLAPRFRIHRSWHAEHVCLSCLIEWCSIVNWWCEVFLICLEKKKKYVYVWAVYQQPHCVWNESVSS